MDIGFEDTKQNKVAKLSTYMNTSRQINNSENYNEDGTIKKGIIKNGRKIPLTWHYSMGYYKAKDYLANIRRIQAEQRKIRAGILANRILEMGYDIHIKDYRSVYAKELINR